jgi:hypothetical protein
MEIEITQKSKLPPTPYAYIYLLRDPCTREICYVGQTRRPHERYYDHIGKHPQWHNIALKSWMMGIPYGYIPRMYIIKCVKREDILIEERKSIEEYWSRGEPLTNQQVLYWTPGTEKQKWVFDRLSKALWAQRGHNSL